jgi:hypothetical protein
LVHCWRDLKECPKWQDLHASFKKNASQGNKGVNDSSVIDVDEAIPSSASRTVWTRGSTNSKIDEKREASSLVLQETLKGLVADKEVSTEKDRERKHREKEEQMKNYLEVQKKEAQY